MVFSSDRPNSWRLAVANKQGGVAGGAIDGVDETIDSLTNTAVILVGHGFPGRGITVDCNTSTIASYTYGGKTAEV